MRFFAFSTPPDSVIYTGYPAAAIDDWRRGRRMSHALAIERDNIPLPAGAWLFLRWQNPDNRTTDFPAIVDGSGKVFIDGDRDIASSLTGGFYIMQPDYFHALQVRGDGAKLDLLLPANPGAPKIHLTDYLLLTELADIGYAPNARGSIAVRPRITKAVDGTVHSVHYPSRLMLRMRVRADIAAAGKLRDIWEMRRRVWCWAFQGGDDAANADWAQRDVLRPVEVVEFDGFSGQDGTAIGRQGRFAIAETSAEL